MSSELVEQPVNELGMGAGQDRVGLSIDLPEYVFETLVDQAAAKAAARLEPQRAYMTTEEVADYLHWPKKRIDNLCSAGTIPYRKVGGRRAFIRHEIDAWVDAQPGITVSGALMTI